MPYVPFREKEDFSRVQHEPMWLLPCRRCGQEFKITSGQILGFQDICPECEERERQGLPPLRQGVSKKKLAIVAVVFLLVLAALIWGVVALLF